MDSSKDSKTVEKSDIFSNLQRDGLRIGRFLINKAKKGNTVAICKIGDAYLNKGTHQDYLKAFRLYNIAAKAPEANATAQYRIGFLFQNGLGTSVNFKEALEWYRKAADQNQPDAQNGIGSMYYQGQGVTVNYKQALKWFRKAATQDNINALYNIGTFYENGIYVTEDKRMAMEWYEKAAKKDDQEAKDKVKILSEQGYSLEEMGLSSPKKEKAKAKTCADAQAVNLGQAKSTEIQESNKGDQDGSRKSKKKETQETIEKLERKLEKEEQKRLELKKRVKDLKSEGKENIKLVEKLKQENLELLQQLEEMKKQKDQDKQVEDRFKMIEGMITQTTAMTISLFNQMGNGPSRSSHKPKKNNQNKLW